MNSERTENKINQIIDFWFNDPNEASSSPTYRLDFWFHKNPKVDEQIKMRFEDDVKRLNQGHYQDWLTTPKGRLACILLIDQFCRQIYRGKPEAFQLDPLALRYCLEGIEIGHDKELKPIYRYFYYLPLEHAEDIALQEKCVAMYESMIKQVPSDEKDRFVDARDYAIRHRDIIQRFGRFPHRNEILGRESTAQEIEFLKQPGSSF